MRSWEVITIETNTSLKDIIAPAFYDLHKDIKNDIHTHYFIKGGRGSTKSSVVSIEEIVGIMKDPNANGICFRKYGTDLKDSVYNQLLWAIDMLGVNEYWQTNLSPLKLTYKPAGQQIIFRGVDDANKAKSIKLQKGYFKFVWFEEADQFAGMEEIRKIIQSLLRSGVNPKVFYTYNPPKSVQSWINTEVLTQRADRLIHHSTYLDVPKEWLGEQFYIEAEHLKSSNEISYNHEYMGEVTGTGGEVFANVILREITNEEIENFDKIYRGLDFGYSIDPCAYVCCALVHRTLYIYHEFYKVEAGYDTLKAEIALENKENSLIYADGAEPRSIAELNKRGLKLTPAIKGKDSVNYGITKLQDLDKIIIDHVRCPNVAREFSTYEIEKDRNGNFKADFPDKNNHSIDAVRYALCYYTAPRKQTDSQKHIDFDFQRPKKSIIGDNPNKFLRR